jgi:hypothetical protein
MSTDSLLAAAERLEYEIALLLNRLVLASAAWGRQEHLDLPVEDRFTDADIDKLEGEIKSNVSRLRALLGESRRELFRDGFNAHIVKAGNMATGEPRVWGFDNGHIAADLEPEAWAAYEPIPPVPARPQE